MWEVEVCLARCLSMASPFHNHFSSTAAKHINANVWFIDRITYKCIMLHKEVVNRYASKVLTLISVPSKIKNGHVELQALPMFTKRETVLNNYFPILLLVGYVHLT